jgi:sulfite exporter TauE/SafE
MDASLATPLAALAAGLATSLHCTAMCGPLACALRVRPFEYHATRLISYSIAGALCGAAGQGVAALLQGSTARLVPWAFALVLIVLGLGLEKRIPQPRFAASLLLRTRLHRSLGWLTPLIPCGPLWLMLGAAALTGAWWSGALHLASFALGTLPLPLLLHAQVARMQRTLSPLTLHACCH